MPQTRWIWWCKKVNVCCKIVGCVDGRKPCSSVKTHHVSSKNAHNSKKSAENLCGLILFSLVFTYRTNCQYRCNSVCGGVACNAKISPLSSGRLLPSTTKPSSSSFPNRCTRLACGWFVLPLGTMGQMQHSLVNIWSTFRHR